jgi:hypothetical protein
MGSLSYFGFLPPVDSLYDPGLLFVVDSLRDLGFLSAVDSLHRRGFLFTHDSLRDLGFLSGVDSLCTLGFLGTRDSLIDLGFLRDFDSLAAIEFLHPRGKFTPRTPTRILSASQCARGQASLPRTSEASATLPTSDRQSSNARGDA